MIKHVKNICVVFGIFKIFLKELKFQQFTFDFFSF